LQQAGTRAHPGSIAGRWTYRQRVRSFTDPPPTACYICDVRVLVVADVHSNLSAFEAVIRDAEAGGPLDAIWVLGDLVGYGPEPGACIALLRAHPHVAVAGNHDRAAVKQLPTDDFNEFAAQAANWTASVLTDPERDYLRSLPDTAVEGEFTLVHGSLRDPVWEYVLSSAAAAAHLEKQTTAYGFIGHSHLQLSFVEHEPGKPRGNLMAAGDIIKLQGYRLVLNPGGLGQPRDGDPRTAYALLDTGERRVSFRRIDYDIRRTQKRMREAGLPDYLIDRLARGR
jgi:predicted phosphodiesterase